MGRPDINHASDYVGIAGCSEAACGMVRSGMRDQEKVCTILLAPTARMAVRMPDQINRPVPQAGPSKHLDPLLMGIDTDERAWRNQVHHAVIVSSNARIVKAVLVGRVSLWEIDSKDLRIGWRGFIRPGKWESGTALLRGKRRRCAALSAGALLQDRTAGHQINAKPLEYLFIGESKAVGEAQHLMDAGQSPSLDSGQRGMRDHTPRVVKAHRERLAHAFDLRRPQPKLATPLSDSLSGIQGAPQQQMTRQIFLANLCEVPLAGRSHRREADIVPSVGMEVQMNGCYFREYASHNGKPIETFCRATQVGQRKARQQRAFSFPVRY